MSAVDPTVHNTYASARKTAAVYVLALQKALEIGKTLAQFDGVGGEPYFQNLIGTVAAIQPSADFAAESYGLAFPDMGSNGQGITPGTPEQGIHVGDPNYNRPLLPDGSYGPVPNGGQPLGSIGL